MTHFNALVLDFQENNNLIATIKKQTRQDLSPGDVLIKVAYSSVNYKDALASQQNSGVVRQYPLIPGIDLSGTVIDPGSSQFKVGQDVLVTGYGLGVSHSGGYSEFAQVPQEWIVPIPEGLDLKTVMVLGTAGLTAALSINALERQGLRQHPEARILVTGASGGVASLAIGMLKKMGYHNITALSRKKNLASDYFKELGISKVITPDELATDTVRPLMAQNYDFILDTVGGKQLELLLPQIAYDGSISLCGNAGGIAFETTVLPYILRGISILGIDSVNISPERRLYIWNRLAHDMLPDLLEKTTLAELSLDELPDAFQQLLSGKMTGRYLVKLTD